MKGEEISFQTEFSQKTAKKSETPVHLQGNEKQLSTPTANNNDTSVSVPPQAEGCSQPDHSQKHYLALLLRLLINQWECSMKGRVGRHHTGGAV